MARPKKKNVLNQGSGRSGAKLKPEIPEEAKKEEAKVGWVNPELEVDGKKLLEELEKVEKPVEEVVPEKPEQPIEPESVDEEETIQTQIGFIPKSLSDLSADEYRRWQRTGKMPQ